MSGAAFPGENRIDSRDIWREYKVIEVDADGHVAEAERISIDGNPRAAQVHATLAVAARLEALTYAIRHAKVF